MNVAVIFNKVDNKNKAFFFSIAKNIERIFKESVFFTVKEYGGELIQGNNNVLNPKLTSSYKENLRTIINTLLTKSLIDVIITVGGDGLASYVAKEVINNIPEKINRPRFFSIGAGTANVGPIVSFTPKELKNIRLDKLELVNLDTLEINSNNKNFGYAFNDLVIGDTLLATVEGECKNISAKALVEEDIFKVKTPSSKMANPSFSLSVNGKEKQTFLHTNIAQIIGSPLQFDRVYGRGILGAICNTSHSKDKAALVISSKVIIDTETDITTSDSLTSIDQLIFTSNEKVEIKGLTPDACVIIDGNPYMRDKDESVIIKFRSSEISCFKQGGKFWKQKK